MSPKIHVCLGDGKNIAMDIPFFEKVFEISYIPHLVFANREIEGYIRRRCSVADRRGRIDPLARWLGTYHNTHLEEEKVPKVTLKWINEQIGYGIFADILFKKWQFIGEYSGILRRRKRFSPNVNDYCFMYPKTFWSQWKSLTVDSEKKGNLTRFINHSDNPNAESICIFNKGIFRVIIRALKEIMPGEEITYDYGEYYWQRRIKLTESSSIIKEGEWLAK